MSSPVEIVASTSPPLSTNMTREFPRQLSPLFEYTPATTLAAIVVPVIMVGLLGIFMLVGIGFGNAAWNSILRRRSPATAADIPSTNNKDACSIAM